MALAHATGFDVETPVIEAARAHAAESGPVGPRRASCRRRPARCPSPTRRFDMVFSKDALLHVPDKDALFAEIFRVLKPGGVFAAQQLDDRP